MPEPISFKLNGEQVDLSIEGGRSLLWILRNELDRTGTKFGCGWGYCGACTVLVDGRAEQSCTFDVGRLQGREVTTIEGLSADGSHPLQIAWLNNNVPQCGYCQAGQIMSAADLLAGTPSPSHDQIEAAMQGNICRCGTYKRIRKAIADAAEQMRGA